MNNILRESRLLHFSVESLDGSRTEQTPEQKTNVELELIRTQAASWLKADGMAATVKVDKGTTYQDVHDEVYVLSRPGEEQPLAVMPVQAIPTRLAFVEWVQQQLKTATMLNEKTREKYRQELAPTIQSTARPTAVEINKWLLEKQSDASVQTVRTTGLKGVDDEHFLLQKMGQDIAIAPASNFVTKVQVLHWIEESLQKNEEARREREPKK